MFVVLFLRKRKDNFFKAQGKRQKAKVVLNQK